tara:strand:+ start:3719 stop:3991 length:273 start_codon:yes stop_codon:yes gene_type:complete
MDFMNAVVLQLVPKVLTVAQGLWILGILKAARVVGSQPNILGLPHRGQFNHAWTRKSVAPYFKAKLAWKLIETCEHSRGFFLVDGVNEGE